MNTSDSWPAPPVLLPLSQAEVHVWRVSLDQPANVIERLRSTLAEDERVRAAKYHFAKDQVRFVVGRGALRSVLGRYLSVLPGSLQFHYGPHGKPSLAAEFAGGGLDFNISHSHSLALFALARGRALGVDLEQLRADADMRQIAKRFFSASEVSALCGLPAAQQPRAFFDCWTRKEAYVKARGEGLSFSLAEFDVSLRPDEPAALLRVRGDAREAEGWTLHSLDVAHDYAAALVAEGHCWHLKTWQWVAD